MRTIVLLFSLFWVSLNICAQDDWVRVKVNQNEYEMRDAISVLFLNRYPRKAVPENEKEWRSFYDLDYHSEKDPYELIFAYLAPYVKKVNLGEKSYFDLIYRFSLKGELLDVLYMIPGELRIVPLEVWDQLDTALREDMKATVKSIPRTPEKGVYWVSLYIYYDLKKWQEKHPVSE